MKDEKFVWVKGYEGKYQVGDMGTVKSFTKQAGRYSTGTGVRSVGKVLTPQVGKNGYLRYSLYNGIDRKPFQVTAHRLVYTNWIGEAPEFNDIGEYQDNSHKNHKKHDNSIDNLILESHKANINRKDSHLFKPVASYTIDGTLIKEYPSLKAATADGFDRSGLTKAMREERTFKGLWWKFIPKKEVA